MRATRIIGLSIVGILGLAACTSASGSVSDAAILQTSTPPPTASPSDVPGTSENYDLTQPAPTNGSDPFPEHSDGGKIIYLTFDDGPWDTYTAQILDILGDYDAKATFFVNGVWAKQRPELIDRIAAEGHAIGNHTWSHANLTSLDDVGVRRELESTAEIVGPAMGPCMRPPYGGINSRVRNASESLGYQPIMWTAHAYDWEQPTVTKMVADMKTATKSEMILLLHDGGGYRTNTVEAVRQMIPKWQEDGYTLESVPACRT